MLYLQQPDRLFKAGGFWNFKQCANFGCRLIWLDPMPLKEDINKAYADYYTHALPDRPSRRGLPKKVYLLMKEGYLADRHQYRVGHTSLAVRAIGKLMYLFPLRRAGVDAEVRFIRGPAEGRVLDVGCGSGEWLLSMRAWGWDVQGVDFDEGAVAIARHKGLPIHLGSLESADFPDNAFDAVTLSHVIEHVADPIHTLEECRRVLKPGGTLLLFTPNAASFGHRLFKRDWRGLEPPRHLHLFCPRSMARLLRAAGYSHFKIRTFNTAYMWEQSLRLRTAGGVGSKKAVGLTTRLAAGVLTLIEQILLIPGAQIGECLCVQALKGQKHIATQRQSQQARAGFSQ